MEKELKLEELRKNWLIMSSLLDERSKRIWAGLEADRMGWGGISLVATATGLSRKTISKGLHEVQQGVEKQERTRQKGGGRKSTQEKYPDLLDQLEALIAPHTKGDPMRPLRWTSKSTYKLSEALRHCSKISYPN